MSKTLKCNFCGLLLNHKSSLSRHKKLFCYKKKELEAEIRSKNDQYDTKKELEKTKRDLEIANTKIMDLTKELDSLKTKMMQKMETQIEYLYETQKNSATTLDKSMDALTFLMTHRKNAPQLKKLTHKKAQELLTSEAKLYTHLLHHNEEKTLDQYIGEIILTHIKKKDPDEQSVWNSDVSRLTFLIREIVDESPTWLRDPKGAAFNAKIIVPIINAIKTYLEKCLHSTNPDKVNLDTESEDVSEDESEGDSDNESEKSVTEHDKMRRSGRILDTIETLKSKAYRKSLSEYVASHIPLHKLDKLKKKTKYYSSDSDTDQKPKKITKKQQIITDSDTDQKPKKVIKKQQNDTDSDTDQKPKKVIKKQQNDTDSDTDQKPKKVIKKK